MYHFMFGFLRALGRGGGAFPAGSLRFACGAVLVSVFFVHHKGVSSVTKSVCPSEIVEQIGSRRSG